MTEQTDSKPKNDSQGFFDNPTHVTWILRVFYLLCGLLVAADFVVHRHIYTEWESIPTFYALYGFVACVLLVVLARQMRLFLMRDEHYYDSAEPDSNETPPAHKEAD